MFWIGVLITLGFLIAAGFADAIAWLPLSMSFILVLTAPLIGGGAAAQGGANPIRSSVLAVMLGVLIPFAALFWVRELRGRNAVDPYESEQMVHIMLGYLVYCTLVAGFVGWLQVRDLRRESSNAR